VGGAVWIVPEMRWETGVVVVCNARVLFSSQQKSHGTRPQNCFWLVALEPGLS
jgi:hypothetical protein